jgi:hypothetical protein
MGLVVGNLPPGQTGTWYLIRAVGPSLSQFGITNGASQLKLTLFNAQQQNINPIYVYTINWGASFAAVGAFPFLSGTSDQCTIVQLEPGAYTVQVGDMSGKGGVVLIESYLSPGPVIVPGVS